MFASRLHIFQLIKRQDLEEKCHFVNVPHMCAAASALAVTDWHWHSDMSATPCLHICSCSDRNNTRPSLLHPYLDTFFTVGDHYSMRTERNGQEVGHTALFDCRVGIIIVVLHHKVPTCTEMSNYVSQSWAPSCFTVLVCEQTCGFKSDLRTLSHVFSVFFLNHSCTVSCRIKTKTA